MRLRGFHNGPTPEGVSPGGFRSVGPLPDRPMPENPDIPEFPEIPDVPEAPKMPESRPRRSPERLRASILSDLESISGSISVVFRGYIAWATPLAARRAEPLFLLAGAVLQKVRRLCETAGNSKKTIKISQNRRSRPT